MTTVVFTQNLQRHLECPPMQVPGSTVQEVLEQVFASYPRAKSYVLDEHGAVRHHMVIFLNNEPIVDRTTLSDVVTEGSELYIMQALSGGSR
ncbi:MAG: MoaD/ThiS family protein [Zavarzinella sp.]